MSRIKIRRSVVIQGVSRRIGKCMLLALSMLIVSPESTAQEQTIEGEVVSATIYLDQASVVRKIPVPASDQLQQIRVTGLPSELMRESVVAETDSQTVVRSIDIRQFKKEPDPERDALRKKNAIETEKKLIAARRDLSVIEQDLETIEQLVDFSSDRVAENLGQSKLDVQTVTSIADFTMKRRRELAAELFAKQSEIDSLTQQQRNGQGDDAPDPNVRGGYDAILTVESPGGGHLLLSYGVTGVRWAPHYTIRCTNDAEAASFSVGLDARIVQHSGEDWRGIKLSLATSTPSTQSSGPRLAPLRVKSVPTDSSIQHAARTQIRGQTHHQQVLEWLDAEKLCDDVALNTQASIRQITEMTSSEKTDRTIASDASINFADEIYQVPGEVSLENKSQSQTLTITSWEMQGKMHRVVTPLLSSFAYREASWTNSSDTNFIAGPADVVLNGRRVGKTMLPPIAVGQKMTIGFGPDRQVRTRRELLSRRESTRGGNRRADLKYRLVVSNFHDEAIEIRLLDRIPMESNENTVSLSITPEEEKRLSLDPLYQRMQRPEGILRWDIGVPPKRFGSNAYDHEFEYSIEFDRQQTIVGSELVQRIKNDLRFRESNGGGMGGGLGGNGGFQ